MQYLSLHCKLLNWNLFFFFWTGILMWTRPQAMHSYTDFGLPELDSSSVLCPALLLALPASMFLLCCLACPLSASFHSSSFCHMYFELVLQTDWAPGRRYCCGTLWCHSARVYSMLFQNLGNYVVSEVLLGFSHMNNYWTDSSTQLSSSCTSLSMVLGLPLLWGYQNGRPSRLSNKWRQTFI